MFELYSYLIYGEAQGDSRTLHALNVTPWEAIIALTFMLFGWGAYIVRPDFKTLWLALLLALQASLYLAAPDYSLLSIRTKAEPVERQIIHRDFTEIS